jgi:general transcription factor 3C polypeptide 5 (transcription factor C subunit 1)
MKTVNEQASHRIWTQRVAFDCEAVPTGPVGDIPDMESLEPLIVRAINELKARLEERPIWTRRALSNQIRDKEAQANWSNIGKHVYQYIGYMFRSGPWRDSVVRFGVDPRTDPKYRVYQTMMFQIDDQVAPMRLRNKGNQGNGRGGNRRRKHIMDGDPLGSKSHIFDGIKVGKDAKVWQVIDITDTLLHQILATDNLRKRCHVCEFC